MTDKDYSLIKEIIDETIESWAKRDYIGKELQEKLVKADVLIIPNEGYGDDDINYFPEGTEHLVSFLQRNNRGNHYIDICIEDSDYKELAQHSDLLIIAGAIATTVFAPILVNSVSEYIKQRLGKRADDTTLKTSLTITNKSNGESINLTYEGPASTYENIMISAVKEIIEGQGEIPLELKKLDKAPEPYIWMDNESE